jgi:two-component system C4-dicarboxylate transport response regulator DctD
MPVNLSGTTVLLIEDDSLVRESIREHLELRGYKCIEAAHGGEALQSLQSQLPDIIVSDISMPVMGGIEFLVKSRALGCRVPIIFLTGVNDSTVRTLGRNAGAFECISKPPDYDQLDKLMRLSMAMAR